MYVYSSHWTQMPTCHPSHPPVRNFALRLVAESIQSQRPDCLAEAEGRDFSHLEIVLSQLKHSVLPEKVPDQAAMESSDEN